MNELLLKIALVVSCAVAGIASSLVFKMSKDNVVEEAAEKLIEYKTGYLVDLSPGDGDPDDNKSV